MHQTRTDADVLIQELRASIGGNVIDPADLVYDTARAVYFTSVDRRPAAIVRPVDAGDVARVIALAREAGIPLAVRGGGHSLAGHGVCDDGIVLDMSSMHAFEIDVANRTAWTEAGITAGEYTAAAAAHGLATGFGDAPSVGVGGITLAGGVGFLHRRQGLTIDHVLAAEIVTADGQRVYADATTNADLFWAIRGGGGNFGVVTRFQFRLHPVDTVVGGMLMLPATPDVIANAVAAGLDAPVELSGMINIMPAPPMPFIPEEQHGKLIVMAMFVYAGDVDAGERAIAPFRALATPLADLIRPMHYGAIYDGHANAPHPAAVAMRSAFVDDVDRAAATTIIERLETSRAPMRVAQMRVLGGAVARVPVDATAFAHRDRRIMMNVGAMFERPEDTAEHRSWACDFTAALPTGAPGAYVAFLGDEGEARVHDAYPARTWQRLARIKRRYDPENLFRGNQNVAPLEE